MVGPPVNFRSSGHHPRKLYNFGMRDDPKERRAIEGLLEYLSPVPSGVDRWPDREERNERAIDAVAGPYAIEHTCVDSFPGQSEDTSFFNALATIERDTHLNYRLVVSFPVGALRRGDDWPAIIARVRRWLADEAATLAIGYCRVSLDGVPFVMHVWREDDSWAPGLYVCRQDPGNDGFVDMVKSQTSRKIAKLASHQKAGATTVLLLETRCTALMSSC